MTLGKQGKIIFWLSMLFCFVLGWMINVAITAIFGPMFSGGLAVGLLCGMLWGVFCLKGKKNEE